MGLMTTAIVGMGVATAASQIAGGYAANKEAKYNASIYHQQAGMIDEQKKLQAIQDDRAIRQVMGSTTAATASKGIQFSGSPIAIMIDTRTQLEMDKAIGQYNLDVQKYGVMSQADAELRRGRTTRTAGIVGGLTTLMQTGLSYAAKGFDTKKYVTVGGKRTLVAPDNYYLRASRA
jgi:hypothetical protein